MMTRIDRIDNRGDIREHVVSSVRPGRTLCGLPILHSQEPAGNRECRCCARLEEKAQTQAAR